MIDARAYVTNPQGRYKVPWSDVIGIAVHHSVTWLGAEARVGATQGDELAHIREIDAYHVSQGWGGFGYHIAVFPSGRVYLCGDLDGARAHVASRNHELRGIVLIGDFSQEDPTQLQLRGAVIGIAGVRVAAGRDLPVAGHRTWALPQYPTSCPGDRLAARVQELNLIGEEDDMPEETVDKIHAIVRYLLGPGDNWIVATVLRAQAAAYRRAADALDEAAAVQEQVMADEAAKVPWPNPW